MICHVCTQDTVVTPSVVRLNNYASSSCKACGWQHSYWVSADGLKLSWIQKRFAHNGTTWHCSFNLKSGKTKFTKVVRATRKERVEGLVKEETHELPGMISPERFIAILPFI